MKNSSLRYGLAENIYLGAFIPLCGRRKREMETAEGFLQCVCWHRSELPAPPASCCSRESWGLMVMMTSRASDLCRHGLTQQRGEWPNLPFSCSQEGECMREPVVSRADSSSRRRQGKQPRPSMAQLGCVEPSSLPSTMSISQPFSGEKSPGVGWSVDAMHRATPQGELYAGEEPVHTGSISAVHWTPFLQEWTSRACVPTASLGLPCCSPCAEAKGPGSVSGLHPLASLFPCFGFCFSSVPRWAQVSTLQPGKALLGWGDFRARAAAQCSRKSP